MQSIDWRSRAEAYCRMAQKVPSLAAKQRLLAQQQKCLAMARAAEKQEHSAPASGSVTAEDLTPSGAKASAREVRRKFLASQQIKAVSRPEPSRHVKASPILMKLWKQGVVYSEELERRAREVEHLKQRFSTMASHVQRAADDPDYWSKLYDSQVAL